MGRKEDKFSSSSTALLTSTRSREPETSLLEGTHMLLHAAQAAEVRHVKGALVPLDDFPSSSKGCSKSSLLIGGVLVEGW